MNVLPTLGEVTSDDLNVLKRLGTMIIKQEEQLTGTTPKARQVTAAAGSTTQLARVEAELKHEPIPPTSTSASHTTTTSGVSTIHKPQVNVKPFRVDLIRLSQKDIKKYHGKPKIGKVLLKTKNVQLKNLEIRGRKLPITPNQSVTITSPSMGLPPKLMTPVKTHSKTCTEQKALLKSV